MTNETEQLRAQIATLHEVLEEQQWSCEMQTETANDVACCPACYESEAEGHKPNCWLATALSNTAETARLHDLAVTRKALEKIKQQFSEEFYVRSDHSYSGFKIHEWLTSKCDVLLSPETQNSTNKETTK